VEYGVESGGAACCPAYVGVLYMCGSL